jgi:S-formylglutathione hydrolase FrmB
MVFLQSMMSKLPTNFTVANATMDSLPALKASSFAIAGFSSGALTTNNLCNQNPQVFDGCGSFCGLMPALDKEGKTQPSTPETIHTWRHLL